MKMRNVFTTCLLAGFLTSVLACSQENNEMTETHASHNEQIEGDHADAKVIYGRDDRMDLYQVTNPAWKKLAGSTAALIRNSKLSPRPGSTFAIKGSNFGKDYNLCPSEPFRDQQLAAFCSGFLVTPDVMVSAGHCIKSQSDCDNTSYVFGYAINQQGQASPTSVPSSQVYKCRKVIKTQVTRNDGIDFSVVQLERPVTVATPLKLRASGVAAVGEELAVIGHPVGLPTKVAANAFVRKVNPGFLVVSLDTYGGNSGSAVFNVKSGEVEGILVRGDTDFMYAGGCRMSKTCTQDGCMGEEITRIEHVRSYLQSNKEL